jgi:LysR family transcriptional activator of nhaA
MDSLQNLDGVNLNHLLYFHLVASHGSIAAAARALHVAPSTIGEQIRELEASLGEPLFTRSGRELKVNDAGRLVLEQTALMVGAAERIVARFHPERAPSVTLRVGYSSSLSRTQVAYDLMPLLELNETRVRIECVEAAQLTQTLLRGEMDLALGDQPPPDNVRGSIGVEALAGSPLVVVASSRVVSSLPAPEQALSQLPLFQYTVTSRLRLEVEQWLRQRSLRPRVIAETDDCGIMLAAASAGRCFALVPQASLLDVQWGLHIIEQVSDTALARYVLFQGGTAIEVVKAAVALLVRALPSA